MKRLPKPKFEFRLYVAPRSSPQYFEVKIHRDQKDLMKWRTQAGVCEAFFRGDSEAWTVEFLKDGTKIHRGNPRLGALHFYLGALTMGIIAHEFYHAVTYWAEQIGCTPRTDPTEPTVAAKLPDYEELCAELMGCLTAQFFVWMAEHGGTKIGGFSVALEKAYYS